MMYKQVLIPDKKNHSFKMPERFYGKKVEVRVVEIADSAHDGHPTPPSGKTISASELLEGFGTAPDFPSVEEIREKAWPSKW